MPKIPTGQRRLPWVKPKQTFQNIVVADDFYNTPDWRRFRKVFIATHPLCVSCEAKGIVRPSSVADHITPINQGGERFDPNNIQALCAKCHNTKSARDRWRKHGKT